MNISPDRIDVRAGLGIFLLLLLALFLPRTEARGQGAQPEILWSMPHQQLGGDWTDCGLRKVARNAHVTHWPALKSRPKISLNIEVDYGDGFSPEAREAFERAVAIWEAHLHSAVTIRVDASFEALEEGIIGGASPNRIYGADTSGDGNLDLLFGDPLADAVSGEDQRPGAPDMRARFNKDRDDWHFGQEPAPSGRIDFTTVALHEIGHGLNYFDFFRYNNGKGEYGIDFDGNGRIDDDERVAGTYGQHIVEEWPDGSFRFLTNEAVYPNPSDTLGEALTSNHLFFVGDKSEQAAQQSSGPRLPKLYAPRDFQQGSSISHLDEQTYPSETRNALMTPRIRQAETVRRPGPIVCGQLLDIGWPTGAGCAFEEASIAIAKASVRAGPANRGSVTLRWKLTKAPVDSFIIKQDRFFDPAEPSTFVRRQTVPGGDPGTYSTTVEDVRVGTHKFRVTSRFAAGDDTVLTVEAQRPELAVYPNPFTDIVKVSFVLPEAEHVRVEVYDVLGRRVALLLSEQRAADTARPVVFDASRLLGFSSGVYFFQVTGETFSVAEKAVRIR